MNISQKGLLLVVLPLLTQILLFAGLNALIWETEKATEKQIAAKNANILGLKMVGMFFDSTEAMVQYGLTRDESDLERYRKIRADWDGVLKQLEEIVVEVPAQDAIIKKIDENWRETLEDMDEIKRTVLSTEGGTLRTSSVLQRFRMYQHHKKFRGLFKEFNTIGIRLEKELIEERIRLKNFINITLLTGCTLNAFIAIGLAVYFSKSITRRLRLLNDNTERIATGRELNPPVQGRDEIASLDKAFHRMASMLDEAVRQKTAIADNALDVICSINADFEITSINPAIESEWGYGREDMKQVSILDMIPDSEHDSVVEKLGKAINEEDQSAFDSGFLRENGEKLDVIWSCRWSKEDNALFCVIHEITERKRLEQMQQDLLRMVSHDIRTPLTTVAADLEYLIEGKSGQQTTKGSEVLERANRSVERMQELVVNLLDLDRMESSEFKITRSWTSTDRIFDQALSACSATAKEKSIKIIILPREELSLKADEKRLVQVMVNLLFNAIKHSKEGGQVSVEVFENGSNKVRFVVKDNGPGISGKDRLTVFEKFSQVSTTSSDVGSGLGLAICKTIILAHGGSIGVQSELQKGSDFWFEIPVE